MKYVIGIISLVLFSCQSFFDDSAVSEREMFEYLLTYDEIKPIIGKALTEEERDALSPSEILFSLKAGNQYFVNHKLTARVHSDSIRIASWNQYPKAIILSCFDSRIPVEDIFEAGIGELLVLRVAGNVVNQDILGSLEYGVESLGAKVIVVLGHNMCTSVGAAIDDYQRGSKSSITHKIQDAIANVDTDFFGPLDTRNMKYYESVADANITQSVKEILDGSGYLKRLVDRDEILIVGAKYDMNTGKVNFAQ